MKIMMFLEHKFFKDKNGKLYSEKVITDEILERYTSVFGNVTICARGLTKKPINGILLENPEVDFYPLPIFSFNKIFKNFHFFKQKIKKTAGQYDGFIIRAPSSISLLAYSAVKRIHKPVMVELVIDPIHFFYEQKKLFYRILRSVIVKHTQSMCKKVNAVLYVTKFSLEKRYKSKSMLSKESDTHFHVACSDVILKKDNYFSEIKKHNPGEPFLICHTGWMVGYNKGHKTVINIAKKMNENGMDTRVYFIGDGEKKREFEQYAEISGIKDKVVFCGKLQSSEEMNSVMRNCHLFLFPSVNEGLPRALLEAMANSLPCAAYDTDGIPELLKKNYLAEIGDEETLFKIAENFYKNEENRIDYAGKCYRKALEYSFEELNKKRSKFYKEFLRLVIKSSK